VAALAIMTAQLILGGWFVSPWLLDGGGTLDIVTFLIFGGSLLAGVPGSVLTHVAIVRRSAAAARAAARSAGVRAALLIGVTTVIVVATDPGPGAEWLIDWELIVLGLLEIAVSYALAHDTARRQVQRLTQV